MHTDQAAAFGQWLRTVRRASDLTREQLALCAGCSPATIEKIELGERRPSRQLAELIAHCLAFPEEKVAAFVLFARGGGPARLSEGSFASTPESAAGGHAGSLHLPARATAFIGRERELGHVRQLLGQNAVRLLTLAGPPGIGKTSLSLQAAEESGDLFPHGVFYVPVASVADPDLVVPQIGRAIGVREGARQHLVDTLMERLWDKKLLVVLDNLEHLRQAAPEIARLLVGTQGLKILATSRVALHIYGEHLFSVPPMLFPDVELTKALIAAGQIDKLADFEAIALFVQRARAVQSDFVLTGANAGAVAEICRKLDGLPLAIELAAFRSKVLSPEIMLQKLGRSLDLLADGPTDLPQRQRSLRGAVAWSYEMLSPAARRLFNRLSVFVGGCDFQGVEYLSGALSGGHADEANGLVDTLSALVDSSLLRSRENGGEPRFSMLETVREYAAEQLAAGGEAGQARRAHAEYYLALTERAEPHLAGPDQSAWLARLEGEHDNLRAALRYFADEGRTGEVGRMAASLRRFWYFHSHLSDGLTWVNNALRSREQLPASVVARLLQGLGNYCWVMGDFAAAHRRYSESLAIYRTLDDKQGIAALLNNLGITLNALGDYDNPPALYLESLQICREIGDDFAYCVTLSNLGLSALNRGQYDQAQKNLAQSLELRRALGDTQGEAQSLNNLGLVARCEGEYERARALHTRSLEMFQELGDRWSVALALANLGYVALGRGEAGAHEAAELLKESLALHRDLSVRPGIADCLEGLAQAAHELGELEAAAMLFGAGEKLREELGMPILPYNRLGYKARRASTIAALGDERFEAAWRGGRAMNIGRASSYALDALT